MVDRVDGVIMVRFRVGVREGTAVLNDCLLVLSVRVYKYG